MFGPKFHPELAAVEYFLGEMKKFLRANWVYTLETLRVNLPLAIASVPVATIRRHFPHDSCYMRVNMTKSLSIAQIEWAMRKSTSHKRAKEPLADLDADTQFIGIHWFDGMPDKLKNSAVTLASSSHSQLQLQNMPPSLPIAAPQESPVPLSLPVPLPFLLPARIPALIPVPIAVLIPIPDPAPIVVCEPSPLPPPQASPLPAHPLPAHQLSLTLARKNVKPARQWRLTHVMVLSSIDMYLTA